MSKKVIIVSRYSGENPCRLEWNSDNGFTIQDDDSCDFQHGTKVMIYPKEESLYDEEVIKKIFNENPDLVANLLYKIRLYSNVNAA